MSVEIESRSHYLFGGSEKVATTVLVLVLVLVGGTVVSTVCVTIIEVGVPDTSEIEKVTTSVVITTPATLAAKAGVSES